MKQLLSKEDVKRAMESFASRGKKPTLALLHAALNHRGSMSTLCRLKSEVEAAAQPANDSEEGLKAFRELWALAFNEGRVSQEATMAELRENLKALSNENERLEGLATAAQEHADAVTGDKSLLEAEFHTERSRLGSELNTLRTSLVAATAEAAEALQKLAEAQAVHASQVLSLQQELSALAQRSHDLEVKLVRCSAIAEANGVNLNSPGAGVPRQD